MKTILDSKLCFVNINTRTNPPSRSSSSSVSQDSHKSVLLSVNVVGAHLAEHAADAGRAAALQRRMADVNEGWDGCCEEAALWQTKLQTALLEVGEEEEEETENGIFPNGLLNFNSETSL